MKRFNPSSMVMAGAVLVFVACGSSDAGPPVPIDDFPRLLAAAHCDNIGPCCGQAGYAYDHDQCQAAAEAGMRSNIDSVRANPNIKYDPNAARTCLNAYTAMVQACHDERDLGDACRYFFVGTLQAGEPCTSSAECVPGNSCQNVDGSSGMQCTSTSSAHGKLGDGCWATCTENGTGGSTCSSGRAPGSNPGNFTCFTNDGLYCDGMFHCANQPALGQPCVKGDPCAGDAFCDDTGLCAAKRTTGSCVSTSAACAASAYCASSTLQCTPRQATGSACTIGSECPITDRCANGTCKQRTIASAGACMGNP